MKGRIKRETEPLVTENKELKRQLAVVNGKLDNLQAQNEALRAELARLKQEK